jgi:hypothetical protein
VRTCFSASRGGKGCISHSRTSPCRGGKDCTPHTVSSPSRASIVCFPFFARHETRCVRASAATANVGVVAFHQLFVCSEADAA